MSNQAFSSNQAALHLSADCEQCFGLCCVALPYGKSSDFAFDKSSGTPCPNLRTDNRCGIHTQLRQKGFKGCTVYDCFGAGQKLSQVTYGGKDWRDHPESAAEMFDCLPVMKQLHEMLSYVNEMLQLPETSSIHLALQNVYRETERLTDLEPSAILHLDIPAHRAVVNELLVQASEMVRAKAKVSDKAPSTSKSKKRTGRDFLGANLKGADLRGASFRGALMIAANLQNADMRSTDLIGADLRDADLSGADLRGSIFLTQSQLNSAKGSAATKLSGHLNIPEHWL
ncbi:pentapeptide repeat-containing protein [Paenibacillus sp. UMB7766-LJ446]|uniref:pentapeptide repeat-containing protein n=1 Tax=Paenibacillus sp. UMB7766-LJ446 TaxID=3046313 RepID=UPI00254FD1D1|nr:pentapeptide repeat-containing protein [Paenibacillus sp. UMB7766-LJ446]MDK8191914.1 pentapeptide repeat-containing protein [Paenibacillus sp. UMB7766-LJ446]